MGRRWEQVRADEANEERVAQPESVAIWIITELMQYFLLIKN